MVTQNGKDGATVLITGGTQGIGLEFAKIFAKDGYNLIIVGRTLEKTQAVAHKLMETFPVTVLPLVQDLSDSAGAQKLYDDIQASGMQIDILINNAGFGIMGDFASTQLEYEIGMMRLNMESVVRLTKLFLPHMVGEKQGRILNVASMVSFQPGPHMAVYSATKAFVLSFSEALSEELKAKNIHVTALCPGPTKTGFQAAAKMGELRDEKGTASDPYVVALLGYKGLMAGKRVVIPGIKQWLLVFIQRFVSRAFTARQAGKLIKSMVSPE